MGLLAKRVSDPKTLQLLENVIRSYGSGTTAGGGIPLGNLTSQLFSNVYMDPFDQFMKRILRVKCYIRYADDFVVLSRERKYLEDLVPTIKKFFAEELGLEVHPNKIELKKWHQGVDFLGAIMFPHFRVLRTKTKKRAMRKIGKSMASYKRGVTEYENTASIIRSYLGIMDHVNSFGLKRDVLVLVRNGSTALENVEKH
jgi:RNA-directed DNA polymerase